MCLTGIERRQPASISVAERAAELLGDQLDLAADEAKALVRQQRARAAGRPRRGPGSRCRSRAPGRRRAAKRRDRLHRRREAGDRPGAQVVAVGEAAGDDDRVEAREVGLLVPDAAAPRRPARRPRRRRARRRSPGTGGRRSTAAPVRLDVLQDDLEVLDQRVGEQLLAERVELGRVVGLELDQAADPDVRDALEAERRQRTLDRLALRVEDALLGPIRTFAFTESSLAVGAQPSSLRSVIRS